MRILTNTGYWHYKTNYSFSKRIKELCPEAIVAVYGATEFLKDLIKNDNASNTTIIYHLDEIEGGKKEQYFDELKEFERGLSGVSLWQVISTSRGVNAYQHGSSYAYTSPKIYKDRDEILFDFAEKLIKTRTIFNDFKPDIYYESPGMDGWSAYINQQLCMEQNIPYLLLQLTRVKNYFAISDNTQILFPQIDASYLSFKEKYSEEDKRFREAQVLYKLIMSELEDPDYFDRRNSRFNVVLHQSQSKWKKIVVEFMHKNKVIHSNKRLADYLARKYQQNLITDPDFYDELSSNDKYLYYTLHAQPEYSLDVQGNFWTNQIHTIELLSKSVPCDWLIYVKEHPGTIVARIRPPYFYDAIRKYPNVRLVNIFENMHKLIINAQLVAVVVGTAGWEAVQRGVPTISFASNTWDVIGLSRKCTDIEHLPKDIVDEISRIKNLSQSEKRKRLICYLAAILEHSIPLTYPNQYVFTDRGTDEQYEICGNEMANTLLKHLDYLQKEKSYCFNRSAKMTNEGVSPLTAW